MLGSRPTGSGVDVSVPTAGEEAAGGGPVVFPVSDLVWEFVSGEYLPSDNLDARSCTVVGALTEGGALVLSGSRVILRFTSDGGLPANGAPVYLASSQDDSNTGRGKATATQPSTAMPALPLYTQNSVLVGVCVDNGNYGSEGTCVVYLQTPSRPNYIVPTPDDEVFNLHRVTGSSGSDNFSHATRGAWLDGESIMLWFSVDTIAAGSPGGFVATGSGDGVAYWGVRAQTAVEIIDRGLSTVLLGVPWPGVNVLAMTKTGGDVRASLNGQAVEVGASTGDVIAGLLTVANGWDRGGVTAMAKFNRVLSDGELVLFTAEQTSNRAAEGGNVFAPSATVREDAGCLWYIDLTSWTSGAPVAVAGPAGTGFTLTVNGAPTQTAFSYTINRNPRSLYLDGPLPSYDSHYYSRDRQLQRIAYTVSTLFDLALLTVGYALDDTDNADEGSVAILVDGEPLLAIGAVDNNIVRYSPWVDNMTAPLDTFAALGPGPWFVEIVCSDKIRRIDTYISGGAFNTIIAPTGAVYQTSGTSRRLTVVSDSITMAGHLQDAIPGAPAAGAPITRARATYPGRISATGCAGNTAMDSIRDWGNGDVVPFAKYLALQAQEGAPTTRHYLCALGFGDWFHTTMPVAEFAVEFAAFLDALHAADAGGAICVAEVIQTNLYANLNFNGETLGAFNDAVVAVAGTRVWVTLLDLSGPNPITFVGGGNPIDTCPELPGGQIALTDNMQAAAVIGWP